MHVLLQILMNREADIAKANDPTYLKLHPEFVPMPDEPFEPELEMAIELKKLIGEYFGI